MNCDKCNGAMNYNTEGLAKNPKAPHWKCAQANGPCKGNMGNAGWEPSDYLTAKWDKSGNPTPPVKPSVNSDGMRTGCAAHCAAREIAAYINVGTIKKLTAEDRARLIADWEIAMEKAKDYMPPNLEG